MNLRKKIHYKPKFYYMKQKKVCIKKSKAIFDKLVQNCQSKFKYIKINV